jgi:proteic killer suppression protein
LIRKVVFGNRAKKDLRVLPAYIVLKLQDWVEDVEERGLEEVRKVSGYHDEPCVGNMKGYRSIRLSRGYRAYYRILREEVEFAFIERVDNHVY